MAEITSLIMSAGSLDALVSGINRYYFCTGDGPKWTVDVDTGDVFYPDGTINFAVRVVKKGRRYRFELIRQKA